MLGTWLGKNLIDEFASNLFTIDLSQGARIEEVFGQSTLSALFQYSLRKRAVDRRQRPPNFIETDVILRRVRPLLCRNQQRVIRE